jgi:hypothetical protein
MAVLRALGARSVPIVSQGSRYVFAQVIKDVVDFLGLSDDTKPQLSPSELAERYQDIVLGAAIRLCRQMPDDKLNNQLPNRPRSWLVLMHHLFQIPETFLEMEENGVQLTYESLTAPPPSDVQTSESVARFGERTHDRFKNWWQNAKSSDFAVEVEPYFGKTTRHEMFERTVWHSAQHTRQVASLLEQVGIQPDRALSSADIQGLPLTDKVWDES